jgi:hypothetical protein
MAKTKRGLSEAERAERRARDRERLQQAARELLTSDGWQRWVLVRALFHNYSLHNCLLLAAQCRERGIDARRIAGFRAWLKLGRWACRQSPTGSRRRSWLCTWRNGRTIGSTRTHMAAGRAKSAHDALAACGQRCWKYD